MAIPTRQQAIATLEEGHASLTALFARLSDEQMVRRATIGGGDWSAKDLMGHIAFWEELALGALAEWRSGARPTVEAIFEGGVDAANAENQERTVAQSLEEVRARATTAHAAFLDAIQTLTDNDWRGKAPYATKRRQVLGNLLGSVLGAPKRPFDHAIAHLPDLETYVAASGSAASAP